jgi:HSP20 family protein
MPWRTGAPVFETLRNEMDEVMRRFFGTAGEENGGALAAWAPRVDVEETDAAMLVKADVPGVDAKDVEVAVQDRTLTLRGEKRQDKEEKNKQYHRVERFAGSFFRSVPLPAEADLEKITATAEKGVVTVTIPKKPGTQPRKVMVKAKE